MVALLKREQDVIEELLGFTPKRLRHNIQCDVVMITPELAKILLGRNIENNRRVAARRVSRYANQMRLGEWKVSDPLKFNDRGDLFDGQHRLHAVIEAGMAVPFVVLFGYPSESMACVDLGAGRNTSDIAKIEGVDLTPEKASLTVAILGTVADSRNGESLTHQQKIDAYLKYQEQVDFAVKIFGKATNAVRLAQVRAAAAKALPYEDESRLTEFLKVLDTGFPLNGNEDNAAIAMRNVWQQNRKMYGSREVRSMLFRKSLYAVKQFCARRDVKSLREVVKDPYPLLED